MQVLTYEIMFEFSLDSGHLLPLIFLHNFSPWGRSTSLGTAISILENLHDPWMPILQPPHPPIAVEIMWGKSPCCETKKCGFGVLLLCSSVTGGVVNLNVFLWNLDMCSLSLIRPWSRLDRLMYRQTKGPSVSRGEGQQMPALQMLFVFYQANIKWFLPCCTCHLLASSS